MQIAIIGLGYCSISFLHYFVKKYSGKPMINITIIAPQDGMLGIAYKQFSDHYILNVPVQDMNIGDVKGDFQLWLKQHHPLEQSQNNTFAKRHLFGRYLLDKFAQIMQIAPSRNITINYIDSIAISIENNIILFADNTQVTADEIIVAIGLADSYKNSRNILSVWSNEAVKFHTNPNSCNANSIAIVGSNLSAVDVLVNLHFSAYNGDISVISSSGTFPLVHEPVPNITLDISPQDGRFGLHYVAKIIAEQQQQYSLTDAQIATLMRNIWPQIWQYFSSADKELFFSPRYFTKWYKARHRMPPQNAVIVQNMLSSKRINVIKDSVESIVQNANNATINCINMLQDFDLVIDTRHSHKSNKLLQNMLQNSLIVPDIVGYKTNQNHIYLLGSLTTAAHLECTSVPDLHKYARNTADNIMAKINKVYY